MAWSESSKKYGVMIDAGQSFTSQTCLASMSWCVCPLTWNTDVLYRKDWTFATGHFYIIYFTKSYYFSVWSLAPFNDYFILDDNWNVTDIVFRFTMQIFNKQMNQKMIIDRNIFSCGFSDRARQAYGNKLGIGRFVSLSSAIHDIRLTYTTSIVVEVRWCSVAWTASRSAIGQWMGTVRQDDKKTIDLFTNEANTHFDHPLRSAIRQHTMFTVQVISFLKRHIHVLPFRGLLPCTLFFFSNTAFDRVCLYCPHVCLCVCFSARIR